MMAKGCSDECGGGVGEREYIAADIAARVIYIDSGVHCRPAVSILQ